MCLLKFKCVGSEGTEGCFVNPWLLRSAGMERLDRSICAEPRFAAASERRGRVTFVAPLSKTGSRRLAGFVLWMGRGRRVEVGLSVNVSVVSGFVWGLE